MFLSTPHIFDKQTSNFVQGLGFLRLLKGTLRKTVENKVEKHLGIPGSKFLKINVLVQMIGYHGCILFKGPFKGPGVWDFRPGAAGPARALEPQS